MPVPVLWSAQSQPQVRPKIHLDRHASSASIAPTIDMSSDLTDVVVTNDDATIGKYSSVQMGYYIDPYVPILAKASLVASSGGSLSERRPAGGSAGSISTGWQVNEAPSVGRSALDIMPPLINRGYYVRVQAIRSALRRFLTGLSGAQIVSLGAGFDSTYFLLRDEGLTMTKYIELDVSDTILKKSSAIRGSKKLFEAHLPNLSFTKAGEIRSDVYNSSSVDLRDLGAVERVLAEVGLDKNVPTLFLSECVLIYMTVEESARLIEWTSKDFANSYFVLYEQVEPHDNFGQAMISNLKSRGCPLLSIMEYPTIKDQENRFSSRGWEHVEVWNMEKVYKEVVSKNSKEKARVDSLEMMDELEEENLFNRHYFVALASHRNFKINSHSSEPASSESESSTWKLRFEDLEVPLGPERSSSGPMGRRRLVVD